MAVEAVDRPVFGVQFHPESIATEYGTTVVGNFVRYCARHYEFIQAQHTQSTTDIA
jgi:para-aminobenzoate synthetase